MLRPLYTWVMARAAGPRAPHVLAAVAFAESSFFPIPPDVMLAPMCLSRPDRAYRYALICSIASVVGGVFGYLIGYFLEPVGQAILNLVSHGQGLAQFQAWYDRWGVWVILIKGFLPIPYKLVTIASGLAHFHFGMFVLASAVTRSARFFLTAFILKRWGPALLPVIEKRLAVVAGVALALLVGGFLLLRLL